MPSWLGSPFLLTLTISPGRYDTIESQPHMRGQAERWREVGGCGNGGAMDAGGALIKSTHSAAPSKSGKREEELGESVPARSAELGEHSSWEHSLEGP